jgi:signal transduction histidine kinase
LLAFSRQQPLRPVETDINSLIDDVFQMLRRTLGATITIKLNLTPEPAIVLVDPNLLESAVLNLALNARDSMPNGGTLCISTVQKATPATSESASYGDTPADQLLITIQDTGTGMSPAILSRAMEPFFTTKEIGQGSGLGLSTAYGFAKQSKGDLLIESQEGIGTKAVLSLPRMAARRSPLNTTNSDGLLGLQQE